jgi:hypothetical protein
MWYVIVAMLAASFGFCVCGILVGASAAQTQELEDELACRTSEVVQLRARCEALEREIIGAQVEELGEEVR